MRCVSPEAKGAKCQNCPIRAGAELVADAYRKEDAKLAVQNADEPRVVDARRRNNARQGIPGYLQAEVQLTMKKIFTNTNGVGCPNRPK